MRRVQLCGAYARDKSNHMALMKFKIVHIFGTGTLFKDTSCKVHFCKGFLAKKHFDIESF